MRRFGKDRNIMNCTLSGEAYGTLCHCQVMRTWRTSGTSISITPQTWPGLYHIWIIIASCLVLEAALSLVKCAGRWASAAAREPAGEHNEDDTHTPDTTVRNVLGGKEPNYLEVKSSGSSPWPKQIFFLPLNTVSLILQIKQNGVGIVNFKVCSWA